MIDTILSAAGIPAKAARYADPPKHTYAVYFDDVTADGADGRNLIRTHSVTVELYEPKRDAAAEAAIEAELDAQGIPWTKQAAYWLSSVQRYQVVYEFDYYEKRRP